MCGGMCRCVGGLPTQCHTVLTACHLRRTGLARLSTRPRSVPSVRRTATAMDTSPPPRPPTWPLSCSSRCVCVVCVCVRVCMRRKAHPTQSGDTAVEMKRKAKLLIMKADRDMNGTISIDELLSVYGKLHMAAMIKE